MTTYTIHPVTSTDPDAPPMVALIGADGYGFLLGERSSVESLHAALTRYLERGKHGPAIDEMDERLGWQWVDIADAVRLADEVGHPISAATIRAACAPPAKIRGATLDGKTWRFPRARFLGWLKDK